MIGAGPLSDPRSPVLGIESGPGPIARRRAQIRKSSNALLARAAGVTDTVTMVLSPHQRGLTSAAKTPCPGLKWWAIE